MAIATSARIHKTAVLEGDIEIGEGVVVDAFAYLKGPLVVGEGAHLFPHAVVGTDAEHTRLPSKGAVYIGRRTVLRELCVVQRGTGDRETRIGDDCYLMGHVQVSHDVEIGREVRIAAQAALAGHCRLHELVTVGMGVLVHQFSTIGAGAMLGMGAVVSKDVPPFCLCTGNPAVFRRLNTHALDRLGKTRSVRVIGGEIASDDPAIAEQIARFQAERRADRPLLATTMERGTADVSEAHDSRDP